MIYTLLKNLIANRRYEKVDMNNKLDVFLSSDRITVEQHKELSKLVNTQ